MPKSFVVVGDDWNELGDNHFFKFVKPSGGQEIIGGVMRHNVKGAEIECEPGLVQWEPYGDSKPLFSVASTRPNEPVSITPFIVCELCGDIGWISRGKWIPKDDVEGVDETEPMRVLQETNRLSGSQEGEDFSETEYEIAIRRDLGDAVLEEELTADRAQVDATGGPQLRLPPRTEEEVRAEHDHVFSDAEDMIERRFAAHYAETLLLTPEEWLRRTGIVIADPDGWRTMTQEEKDRTGRLDGLENWDVPLTRADFLERVTKCTVMRHPTPLLDEMGPEDYIAALGGVPQSERVKQILRENADRLPPELRLDEPENYVEGQGDEIADVPWDVEFDRRRDEEAAVGREAYTEELRERARRAADREVKDSGHRHVFETGAQRDRSAGKGRYDLLQWMALERIAVIMEKGADKYDARNWERGMPMSRFLDSAIRHIQKHVVGFVDEDHLGQAAWNILSAMQTEMMIEMGILPPELNDLPDYAQQERKSRLEAALKAVRDA